MAREISRHLAPPMHRSALVVVSLFVLASVPLAVPAETSFQVIVQHRGTPAETIRPDLDEIAEVERSYSVIDATLVTVDRDGLDELSDHEDVTRIDPIVDVEPKLDVGRPAVQVGPQLWESRNQGADATVAVIDTGIDQDHPGISGRVEACIVFPSATQGPQSSPNCTDSHGHGTHVAGIVGGDGSGSSSFDGSDRKYSGIAPEVTFVSLDVGDDWSSSNLLNALEWVHDNHEEYNISVVQNSWGRTEVGQRYDPGDPLVSASTRLVADDDLAVAFAAGNAGPDPKTLPMEAQNPNVLSVGAIDDTTNVARFSSRGPVVLQDGSGADWSKPDVVAPGSAIMSASSAADNPSRNYVEKSGTSMAAPHVGGILALVRAQHPDLTAPEVHALVRESARDLGAPGTDNTTGHGIVDAHAVFAYIEGVGTQQQTERYVTSGQLQPGPDVFGPVFGRDMDGATASGNIPVKPRATKLTLNVTWQGTSDTTADLSVAVESPSGQSHEISDNSSTRAQDTIPNPERGKWVWQLALEGGSTTVDYTVNASVTVQSIDVPGLRGAEPQPGGGDLESTLKRLALEVEPFVRKYPIPIAIGGIVLVGLIVVAARR